MIGRRQKDITLYYRIYKNMLKGPLETLLFCAACGHGLISVNSDTVEVSNDFGLPPKYLEPGDAWMKLKHTCGAMVVLYWKD